MASNTPSLSRRAALLAPWAALAACGGGESPAPAPVPVPAPAPPVDGPAWFGFARDARHAANSGIAAQALRRIHWSAPVDLAPPYTGSGALLAHYGSPVISRRNTVVMPLRTGGANTFVIEARVGGNGVLLWSLPTAWRPPSASWLPSLNPLITADGRVIVPASGGRVIVRAEADSAAAATSAVAFYGNAAYDADPAAWDASLSVATPITGDAAGNVFFGCSAAGANPLGLPGGIVRLGADGSSRFVSAATAAGDAAMVKPATNSAPALSPDERTLYVVVNNVPATGARASGRIVALDATTLAPIASAALLDPLSGTPAWVNDNATSSPTIGPDGDVYIGVLEASGVAHNFRGWLLHFDAALARRRTPGSFGWDATAGIVPTSMLPGYAGSSPYLLAIKSNSYGGIGTGDGLHRVAIVDPFAAETDRWSSAMVMREVISVLGPTPDPYYPGGVREWCINTMAIDPATNSCLMNSEDGHLYRWHLPDNTLAERIALNNGYAQAYTPTAIGADGRVYAVNNARLFSIGD